MKKIVYLLSVAILITTTGAYAKHQYYQHNNYQRTQDSEFEYKPGPYIGGQFGWARIDEGGGNKDYIKTLSGNNLDIGNFPGLRAVIGYSLIPFFSIEGGYSYYPANDYRSNTDSVNVITYTVDLVGKFILPFKEISEPLSNFNIYVKGGGSFLHTEIENSINGAYKKVTNSTIRPTYGAGIGYNFTDNISVDLSWTGIYGKNRINSASGVAAENPTPTCNMFAAGIYYKFTGLF